MSESMVDDAVLDAAGGGVVGGAAGGDNEGAVVGGEAVDGDGGAEIVRDGGILDPDFAQMMLGEQRNPYSTTQPQWPPTWIHRAVPFLSLTRPWLMISAMGMRL